MNRSREEMLEEMGLGPTWRLRADSAAASISAGDLPSSAGASRALEVTSSAGAAPAENLTISAGVSPAALPRTVVSDRSAAVMRMDWPELKAAVAQCAACALHAKRTNAVFGVGDENAEWMFIGEGPGADEDALGDPFVGQAGRLLDNMLAAIKLARGDNVYIANIVKCRPPGNRNPEPGEAAECLPFLRRQIELVRPKLIVALGKVAAVNLLGKDASIASLRGRVLDFAGTPLIVTYHPAYLLRTLADKAKAWEDLCFARRTMEGFENAKR
jgi:uracil-DNA glycosylase